MSETVKRYDCSNGGARFCQGCYTMEECEHGDYVQHEDYARLEQECERLSDLLMEAKAALDPFDDKLLEARIDGALSAKP